MNTITDNNKMIAQFMGYHYNPYKKGSNITTGWIKDDNKNWKIHNNYLCRKHKELKYHKSWDWIMPVYAKIMCVIEFKPIDGDYIDYLNKYYSETQRDIYDYIINAVGNVNLHNTWIYAIEFITWYMKIKSKNENEKLCEDINI